MGREHCRGRRATAEMLEVAVARSSWEEGSLWQLSDSACSPPTQAVDVDIALVERLQSPLDVMVIFIWM